MLPKQEKSRPGRETGAATQSGRAGADLSQLTRANRQRLLARVDELADLDRLIREPGSLAEAPAPAVVGHG